MKDSAPSPRRLQYLRDYRRRKRSIRLWQVCLLAGLLRCIRFDRQRTQGVFGLSRGCRFRACRRRLRRIQAKFRRCGVAWAHPRTR